jgi:hypothetical protein
VTTRGSRAAERPSRRSRLRRQAVQARRTPRAARRLARTGSGSPHRPAALADLAELALGAAGDRDGEDAVLRIYWTPGPDPRAHRDRPRLGDPGVDRAARAPRASGCLAPVPAPLGAVAPAGHEVRELRDARRGRGGGEAARSGRRASSSTSTGRCSRGRVTNVWWREGAVLLTPALGSGSSRARRAPRSSTRGRARLPRRGGRVSASAPARGGRGLHLVVGPRGHAGRRRRRRVVRRARAADRLRRRFGGSRG